MDGMPADQASVSRITLKRRWRCCFRQGLLLSVRAARIPESTRSVWWRTSIFRKTKPPCPRGVSCQPSTRCFPPPSCGRFPIRRDCASNDRNDSPAPGIAGRGCLHERLHSRSLTDEKVHSPGAGGTLRRRSLKPLPPESKSRRSTRRRTSSGAAALSCSVSQGPVQVMF